MVLCTISVIGKKRATNSESGKFDRVEYDAVLAQPNEREDKVDFLQNDSIQHYLGAIRVLVDEQILLGKTETRREDLMTKSLKDLINLVKNRRERQLKDLSKERIDGEFQPFLMTKQIPHIEKLLWNIKKNTRVYGLNALRNRFQFLMTLGAVMRSDSLYSVDLCDLCDFPFL